MPGPQSSQPPALPKRVLASSDALEVVQVSKFFGPFRAVNNLSFSLPRGCICGFLGPNGAGKTTTLRMILEIIRPSSGTIRILGASSALKVREQIGYLPEEKGLYKKMKAWAVIAYFARLKGLSRSMARQRAHELLERYGLGDSANKPVEALSKGMGQKVQILASIAHDPEFVILDEPFSGLDPVNQQVMEEILQDLARRNRTVLFSTHVMQHAERLCERIILLAKGEKIFDGSIAEAKRSLPRRVRIETADDVNPLASDPQIRSVHQAAPDGTAESGSKWEIELSEGADPQRVLQSCFTHGIRLRSFDQSDPSLHDVFVHLVNSDGGA